MGKELKGVDRAMGEVFSMDTAMGGDSFRDEL